MIRTVWLVDHVTSAEGHVIPQTMTSSCNAERERTKVSYDRDCITGGSCDLCWGSCDPTDNDIIMQRERERERTKVSDDRDCMTGGSCDLCWGSCDLTDNDFIMQRERELKSVMIGTVWLVGHVTWSHQNRREDMYSNRKVSQEQWGTIERMNNDPRPSYFSSLSCFQQFFFYFTLLCSGENDCAWIHTYTHY